VPTAAAIAEEKADLAIASPRTWNVAPNAHMKGKELNLDFI
jgi:hypothetical protein